MCGALPSASPGSRDSCLHHSSIQNSTKGCPNPAASACHSWARHAGSCSFLLLSWVSAFLQGLSGTAYGPILLPLGNISISKARKVSAALTNVGTAPHLLLCACIAARQGDTNEKRAISQSSDCETLCSRRLRHEGMMEEGSRQGRPLQGQEESPEVQALLPGLHSALTAYGFASPGTCPASQGRVWEKTDVFVGDWGQKHNIGVAGGVHNIEVAGIQRCLAGYEWNPWCRHCALQDGHPCAFGNGLAPTDSLHRWPFVSIRQQTKTEHMTQKFGRFESCICVFI